MANRSTHSIATHFTTQTVMVYRNRSNATILSRLAIHSKSDCLFFSLLCAFKRNGIAHPFFKETFLLVTHRRRNVKWKTFLKLVVRCHWPIFNINSKSGVVSVGKDIPTLEIKLRGCDRPTPRLKDTSVEACMHDVGMRCIASWLECLWLYGITYSSDHLRARFKRCASRKDIDSMWSRY
jgi:hypothetical protein